MKHFGLTLSASRPMTRSFLKLPAESGFRFYGIDEKGKRHRCVLLKTGNGIKTGNEWKILSSKAGAKKKYIGWQPMQLPIGERLTAGRENLCYHHIQKI